MIKEINSDQLCSPHKTDYHLSLESLLDPHSQRGSCTIICCILCICSISYTIICCISSFPCFPIICI